MFDRYAQARLGAASGLEPNGDPARPPRVSPHPPRQPETWDQTVPYTRPAGRQPRVLRRVELTVGRICTTGLHSADVGFTAIHSPGNDEALSETNTKRSPASIPA